MSRRISLIVLLGLVVASAGCGGDDAASVPSNPSTTNPSTTTATSIDPAQLEPMLLDAADLGGDWQPGPPVGEADFMDSMQIPCEDTALNPTIAERLMPVTGIQFESSADGPYRNLLEVLVVGEEDQLSRDVQAYFDTMAACADQSQPDDQAAPVVESFSIPELGDQRAAWALTGTEPEAVWYVRTAVVRVGSVAVQLSVTEVSSDSQTEPSIADADFVQILETAVAKVADGLSNT